METNYLQDPSQCGNVLKGFEGFLSASKSSALYGVSIILFLSKFPLKFLDSCVFLAFLTH